MSFHRTPPADPLDDQRALHISAYIALIDYALAQISPATPGTACHQLIERLVRADLASVSHRGGQDRLTLLGIPANSTTAYGLLRNWQTEAKSHLIHHGPRK